MSLAAFLLSVTTNFLSGSSFLATARALANFPVASLSFWRTLLGTTLFLPFLIRALRRGSLTRDDWLRMCAVALFGYAAPLLVGTLGQKLSSATNASLLICVEPVCVVFLSAAFLGEALSAAKLAALGLNVAGTSLIILQGLPFLGARITPHLAGDLLLALQGLLWALYSVIAKPTLRKVPPMDFTAITMSVALIPISLASLLLPSAHPAHTWRNWSAVFYLAAGVTFLGTWTWNKALEEIPASKLANFIFLQPVVGVLCGVFLLKESLTAWSAAGGGLILLGVYCASRRA